MKKPRIALAAFGLAVGSFVVTPAQAADPEPQIVHQQPGVPLTPPQTTQASERDSQKMCDNIPNDDGGGTYTTVCVRVNSDDYGTYRDVLSANVSYYNPKVAHLYNVYLQIDHYSDGWNEYVFWEQMTEGTYYYITGFWDCYDPCRLWFTGIASEPNDPDSTFEMIGPAEADDP